MSNILYPLIRLRSHPMNQWLTGWDPLLCFGPEDIPMVFQAVTWTWTGTSYRCKQLWFRRNKHTDDTLNNKVKKNRLNELRVMNSVSIFWILFGGCYNKFFRGGPGSPGSRCSELGSSNGPPVSEEGGEPLEPPSALIYWFVSLYKLIQFVRYPSA